MKRARDIANSRKVDEEDTINNEEPIAKRLAILPSDAKIEKYIRKIVDNANIQTLSMKDVFVMVSSKYSHAVDTKKYFIMSLVESLIFEKLLTQNESDDEMLSIKENKLMQPSDEEVKRLVTEYLHNSDLRYINVKTVYGHVRTNYQSFENMPLIRETVKSFFKQRSPQADEGECSDQMKEGENALEQQRQQIKERHSDAIRDENIPETFKLTQIGDDRNKISNYYDSKGYMYSKRRATDSTLYLRCKNHKKYSCKASVIVKGHNLDQAVVKKNHNHLVEKKHLDRVKFNKCLEQICRDSPFSTPRTCFHEAKKKLRSSIDMSNIRSLKSFESLIYRNQKVDIPLLPHSIDELEKLITDPKYGKNYTHDKTGKLLFQGVWKGATGNNVAFVSQTTLEQVRKVQHLVLLMDGTFKVLPCHLKFRQLYIINVIIKKRCYPLAFILMEKKDTLSYELVFEKIKTLISSTLLSIECMTDYEAATRKAVKKVFPESKVYGCYFHYVQAITKAFRRYGLSRKYDKFNVTMQKISALALLPNNYVSIGFETIAKSFKKSKSFTRFAKYWRKQWAPANISVYGLLHRTNNFAESLNKSINLLIGNRHPHIWRLIHNLQLVEADKSDELLRSVKSGICEKKKKNTDMKILNKKIRKATKMFDKNQNVEMFLETVTFNENMQNHFKERLYIDGIDEEFSEYADENEDEEVIPNDVREDSNFRRGHPRKCTKSKNRKSK